MEIKQRSIAGVNILDLSGSFDSYTAPAARRWLEAATADSPAYVVVNLKEVSFLDSTGLSTLVQGMKRSRERQGDLRLCSPQPPVRIVFELTRLDRVFEIFPDEEDAIGAFAN